jgi:ubiquinone/menaquinone biosynthesis C-methylase UbiE
MSAVFPRPRHRWFAALYDLSARLNAKADARLRLPTVSQAAGQVLEIGFGTGLNLAYYDWSKVDSLEATEPDVYMLRRAEARLRRLPETVRSKVRLQEAPAEVLPFPDASFDCVVSMLVFCTVSDPQRAMAEVRRVLKPEGRLLLTEHVRAEGLRARLQTLVRPAWSWMAAGCQIDRPTETALRQAGFEVDIEQRFGLAVLLPAIRGVARPTQGPSSPKS